MPRPRIQRSIFLSVHLKIAVYKQDNKKKRKRSEKTNDSKYVGHLNNCFKTMRSESRTGGAKKKLKEIERKEKKLQKV
jgi:hypothetical protein